MNYLAPFFLLAGHLDDCCRIIVRNLHDVQLALAVSLVSKLPEAKEVRDKLLNEEAMKNARRAKDVWLQLAIFAAQKKYLDIGSKILFSETYDGLHPEMRWFLFAVHDISNKLVRHNNKHRQSGHTASALFSNSRTFISSMDRGSDTPQTAAALFASRTSTVHTASMLFSSRNSEPTPEAAVRDKLEDNISKESDASVSSPQDYLAQCTEDKRIALQRFYRMTMYAYAKAGMGCILPDVTEESIISSEQMCKWYSKAKSVSPNDDKTPQITSSSGNIDLGEVFEADQFVAQTPSATKVDVRKMCVAEKGITSFCFDSNMSHFVIASVSEIEKCEILEDITLKTVSDATILETNPSGISYVQVDKQGTISSTKFCQDSESHEIAIDQQHIEQLRFCSHGDKFVTVCGNGVLKMWNLEAACNTFKIKATTRSLNAVAMLNASTVVATGGNSTRSNVCVWDTLIKPKFSNIARCHLISAPTSLCYDPQHFRLYAGTKKGQILSLDTRMMKEVIQAYPSTVYEHQKSVTTACISSLSILASADLSGEICIHSYTIGAPAQNVGIQNGCVPELKFSKNGNMLSCCEDGTVYDFGPLG